jgi:hypothetical protein
MKVTTFFVAVLVSISFSTPVFANEHMHVNHDHEHTRYQPVRTDQSGSDQNTSAQGSQNNTQTVPGSK